MRYLRFLAAWSLGIVTLVLCLPALPLRAVEITFRYLSIGSAIVSSGAEKLCYWLFCHAVDPTHKFAIKVHPDGGGKLI